jgi:hypothetical protein
VTAAALDPGEAPPRSAAPTAFGPWSREFLAFAELFAIFGLAFAQPAFDILSKNVTLLVTRHTQPWQVVVLAVLFLVGPPAVAYAIELFASLFGGRVRQWTHVVLVGIGAAVVVEEAVKHASDLTAAPLIVVGVLAGIAVGLLVRYVDMARTFLRFLAIAPLIFGLVFLGFSPASKTVFTNEPPSASGAAIGNPTRVVDIVMDEFPLGTLLDGSGHIDASLYPNFAKLAATSNWYRNTTTVAPYTEWAVPAIDTGQYPTSVKQLPVAGDHPQSIFRLLGGAYRMNVHEAVTALCPQNICTASSASTGVRNLAGTMRDAADLWREFASPKRTPPPDFTPPPALPAGLLQTQQFIASLTPGTKRVFDYLHVMLPHQPWHLLPSTQDSGYFEGDLATKANLLNWGDEWSAMIGRERHILQTEAADTLLGRIMAKLKRIGAWDNSIVVLTADHGVAFRAGDPLRSVGQDNADQLLWVPLFIKAPGQTAPKVDDRPMQTVDIVPTIADLLHLKIPWKVDGVSALGKPRADFPRRMYEWKIAHLQPPNSKIAPNGKALMFDSKSGWARVMARQAAAPVGDPALRPYRIGPYGALIGTPVTGAHVAEDPAGPSKMYVLNPGVFDNVDPKAALAPWTSIQGSVLDLQSARPVAFAVNGVVAGFGNMTPYKGQTNGYWWASLAPSLFHAGANELTAYAVSGPSDAPVLDPIPIDRAGSPSAP